VLEEYLARCRDLDQCDGLGDVQRIARLADILDLHRLASRRVNTHQRAKVDHFRSHLFMVTHMATSTTGWRPSSEPVSGQELLVTLQEGLPGIRSALSANAFGLRRTRATIGAGSSGYC